MQSKLSLYGKARLGVVFILIHILIISCRDISLVNPTVMAPVDLSGKELIDQNISNYDLSGKNLQDVNLSYSKLINADFTRANLQGANLQWAIVEGANFTQANLQGAELTGVCGLETATWTNTLLDEKWRIVVALFKNGELITKDLQNYDLSGVCFYYADTTEVDFSNANLENAIFHVSVSGSIFQNANLRFVNFAGQDLQGADFTGADVYQVEFAGANLTGAQITPEQLQSAWLSCTTYLPDGKLYVGDGC